MQGLERGEALIGRPAEPLATDDGGAAAAAEIDRAIREAIGAGSASRREVFISVSLRVTPRQVPERAAWHPRPKGFRPRPRGLLRRSAARRARGTSRTMSEMCRPDVGSEEQS